ncbi:hypothetical protein WSM22_09020 [Cytophagales bacterium WSM2-2]|nr:hypothetical protein WSM22_09020 [Cytophagales bacterium WSM2-2]
MEKEKLESLLIDYIDGNLNEAERAAVEKELSQNEGSAKLYHQLKEVMNLMDTAREMEPGVSVKRNFERALREEITLSDKDSNSGSSSKEGKQVFMQPWVLRAAAGIILVIVGIVIGDQLNKSHQHEKEMAELKRQVEENKHLMMSMLGDAQSASQRVMGANAAYELKQADDEIVNALTKAMDEDPNTNVRLTALEALGKFYKQGHVRSKLIKSLSSQKDPVVQIALIRLLVQMKEKDVVNQLEKITRDDSVIKAVKDEAHSGILKLS